eukprot:3260945-Prymnesium_polylepis.2
MSWRRGRNEGARPALNQKVVYFCKSAPNMHCANVASSSWHCWRSEHMCRCVDQAISGRARGIGKGAG